MKEIKCKIYKFAELDADIQQKVIDRERAEIADNANNAWESEKRSSLDEFCNLFDIAMKEWEVSDYHYNFQFRFKNDVFGMDADDVKGKYLARFMRDICFNVYKGKYFGKLIPHTKDTEHPAGVEHIKRYSKVLFVDYDCPLTGVCYDNFLLHPIYEWFKKPSYNLSLYELVKSCLDSFFSDWQKEREYNQSDEFVRNELEENDYVEIYNEDGTLFHGFEEHIA